MLHTRISAASFMATSKSLAALCPLAVVVVGLSGTIPARGGDVAFGSRVISTSADGAASVFAADVDGDGDIDVLSTSRFDDKIAWYDNDGGTPPTFTERVISTAIDYVGVLLAMDLDGDGDIDVLTSGAQEYTINWYENNGGSPPTFTERVISTTDRRAFPGFATDLDGDGDTDFLTSAAEWFTIDWYENRGGSPPNFAERSFSTISENAFPGFATDLDGDGDMDVLSRAHREDRIAWHENNGSSPPSFIERVITEDPDGPQNPKEGFADAPESVFAADMDGDGDIDVLSASNNSGVAWYENDGGSTPTFTPRVISTLVGRAQSVFAADLDGDGDTDAVAAELS